MLPSYIPPSKAKANYYEQLIDQIIPREGAGARHEGRPYAYDGNMTACGAKLIASL